MNHPRIITAFYRLAVSQLSLVALSLICTLAILSPAVHAIEAGGIGGKPANPRPDNPRTQSIFIYEASPGATVNDALEVINNTAAEKTINLYPVDSQTASGGAFACAQKADKATGVGTWIKLQTSQVVVPAKSRLTVPFTVTLPPQADVGEHNGCIAMQSAGDAPETNIGNNGVVLHFRSAIRVAVTVPGNIKKQLSLEKITTKQQSDALRITPELHNTGNVSIDAKLKISAKTLLGNELGSNSGSFPVLRGETSTLNLDVSRPYWGGWYRVDVAANYDAATDADLGSPATQPRTISGGVLVFVMPQPMAMAAYGALLIGAAGATTLAVTRWKTGRWLGSRRSRQGLKAFLRRHYKD